MNKLQMYPKHSITFQAGNPVDWVMRITQEGGVETNDKYPVDECSKAVILALEAHIKHMLNAERQACAEVCDELAKKWYDEGGSAKDCAAAIRSMK